MCGRYSLFAPPAEIEDRFDATFETAFRPRYNLAPRESLPVITNDSPETIQELEWGLVPSWADNPDEDGGHINARAETIEQKASFSDPAERQRCLVLADGFYEWVDEGGTKQPYRVAFEDDRPFAMAGLWERWEGTREQVGLDAFGGGDGAEPEREIRERFTIVTTEPNDLVGELHHRMAAILPQDRERAWLEADSAAARSDLLEPISDDELRAYPVSTAVNDPSNEGPALVEPIGD